MKDLPTLALFVTIGHERRHVPPALSVNKSYFMSEREARPILQLTARYTSPASDESCKWRLSYRKVPQRHRTCSQKPCAL